MYKRFMATSIITAVVSSVLQIFLHVFTRENWKKNAKVGDFTTIVRRDDKSMSLSVPQWRRYQ